MAFPFGGHRRFSELRDLLVGLGCKHYELKLASRDGRRALVHVFEREAKGVLLRATISLEGLDGPDPYLAPSQERALIEGAGFTADMLMQKLH